ncbi:MAG: hypothetical protein HXX13_06145 [Bacteroidetes bacterium]|nr:hypothetical protein [Bacteroidota bacterium]
MSRITYLLLILVSLFPFSTLVAQDLMDLLKDDKPKTEYAYATFKTTRLVLGQSVENPAKGTLQFLIEHNFGRVNQGAYEFFGLDQSTIRIGIEYGINDWLSVSAGRSSYEKTVDGAIKAKILKQSTGARRMPLSVSFYSDMTCNSLKWANPDRKNYFTSRLAFTSQLLIARKFSNALSFQLSPTYVHKNLVAKRTDPNDVFALGAGGRVKITQRTSINAEYFYLFNGNKNNSIQNALSAGVDIETGGHVFQFRITNAQPMFDRAFITETKGKWSKGDIYIGFTINRVFTILQPKIDQKN